MIKKIFCWNDSSVLHPKCSGSNQCDFPNIPRFTFVTMCISCNYTFVYLIEYSSISTIYKVEIMFVSLLRSEKLKNLSGLKAVVLIKILCFEELKELIWKIVSLAMVTQPLFPKCLGSIQCPLLYIPRCTFANIHIFGSWFFVYCCN